jgi:hypothetical protein
MDINSIVQDVIARKLGEIQDRDRHSSGRIRVSVNNHDTRTSEQIAADRFSGLRANNLLMRFEIWLVGRLHRELPYATFYADPNIMTRWYADAFGLDVELDDQTQKAVIEVEARKAASYYYDEVVLKGKKN